MKRVNVIPAVVMMIAGLIACIVAIKKQYDPNKALLMILIVLVLFYLLGLIAKMIIGSIIKSVEQAEEEKRKEEELAKAQLEKEQKEQKQQEAKEKALKDSEGTVSEEELEI